MTRRTKKPAPRKLTQDQLNAQWLARDTAQAFLLADRIGKRQQDMLMVIGDINGDLRLLGCLLAAQGSTGQTVLGQQKAGQVLCHLVEARAHMDIAAAEARRALRSLRDKPTR